MYMCLSCVRWHLVPCQVQDVEGKLPPKVPVVVKAAMTPYQVGAGDRGGTVWVGRPRPTRRGPVGLQRGAGQCWSS